MTFNYVSRVNFTLPTELLEEIKEEILTARKLDYKKLRKQSFRQAFKLIATGKLDSTVIKYNDLEYTVSEEDLLDLKQRLDNNNPKWYDDTAFFFEKPLDKNLQEKIISTLAKELQELNPVASIQTKFSRHGVGTGIPPHRDHNRSTTLWYLLEGPGEETVWWEAVSEFKEYEFWQIADLSKIKKVHRQMLELETWYVFDHQVYHSVVPANDIMKRSSLCIEFNNITAEELFNLVEKIYV